MLNVNKKAFLNRYNNDMLKKIESCKDGQNIEIKGGRLFYKEDEIDFDIEINRKLNSVDTIFLFGFGKGTTIRKLREKFPKVFIVILETNPCLLKRVLSEFDLSDIVSDEGIVLLLLDDKNEQKAIASTIKLLEMRLHWGDAIPFSVPNYDKVDFYNIKHFQEIVYKAVIPIHINRNTLIKRSRQISENAIKNIPSLIKGGYVENLNDYFKDKPAVIVASGPSLNKNLHFLKGIENRCVIIAADSVISTLKREGIAPDFVCGVDYQTINVEKYKSILEEKRRSDVNYVCADGVYFQIPKLFEKSFFQYTPMSFMHLYKDIIGEQKKRRFAVNAVTHLAIQLAYYLGSNPVIFIGQDWAYSGGREHADKTSIEGELPKDVMWVKGNYENKVPTTPTLYSGLRLVEDMVSILSKEGFEFINATEGGAYIEHTQVMSFKEAIDKYMQNPIDKSKLENENQPNYEPFVKRAREIKNSVSKIVKDSSNALKMAKNVLKVWRNTRSEDVIRGNVEIINKINDNITFDNIFQSSISNFYFKEFFEFNKEEVDIEGQSVEDRINQSIKYFKLIKEKASSVKKYVDNLYQYLYLEDKLNKNRDKFFKVKDNAVKLLNLYFEFKNIYDGLKLADEALKRYKDEAIFYYWRAKLLTLNRFMHEEALENFQKAIEIDPDFKKAKFDHDVEKKVVVSHMILAKRALERREFLSAKKLIQRALEYEPENEEVKRWVNIVSAMSDERKSKQRQELLFKQLKMESEAFEEYERIMEFVKKEELDKAYEKLLYLYEKYGAFGDIPFLLGSIMIDKKNLDEAERYLKEAVELIPFQPLVYVALGKLYLMREDYLNAKENLEKALSMNDELIAEIGDALGNLYYEFAEYEKAIKMFENYLPYSNDKKKTVLKVALCYKELGMVKEYNILMDKIRELNSSN